MSGYLQRTYKMQTGIIWQNNRTDDDIELLGSRDNKSPRPLQGNNEPSKKSTSCFRNPKEYQMEKQIPEEGS
ncbi:hypothetical protein M0802_015901 [Mischocyttarus mexicanus]|nr:hypothetical protein M0802_015901 [Mischocyttarus mexicanus]